jgi:hypothetical protein
MVESKAPPVKSPEKSILYRYRHIDLRTERLDKLVYFLPGLPEINEIADRDRIVARDTWESLDTRRRNQAVGIVRRSFLVGRHLVRPPRTFIRSIKDTMFDRIHERVHKTNKIVFRVKDVPLAAMAPRHSLPVTPLVALVCRQKTTPIEDLAVILNSRLFHFAWQREQPKQGTGTVAERAGGFLVPIITKKVGAAFHEVRDELLKLAAENSERLLARDQVHKIALAAKVPLAPLRQTEGIIREINVPRPLGDVGEVKRRGPVVIFRRGSTIVTTTEEAATYLELWLQDRFDQLRGMSKEELEEFIKLPLSTAHVVVVLQHRARIEVQFEKAQTRLEELQREAENRLYDLYKLGDAEREFLRSRYA